MTLGCRWPLVGGEQLLCEHVCSACVPWQAQLWDRELSVSGCVCWNIFCLRNPISWLTPGGFGRTAESGSLSDEPCAQVHAALVPRCRAVLVFLRSQLSSSSQEMDMLYTREHCCLDLGLCARCLEEEQTQPMDGEGGGWHSRWGFKKKTHKREMSLVMFPWL